MSDMIKREDVLRIIDGRFSRTMIGDILKQDINALPEAEAIYVCDRKKCEDCNPLCDFTRDINHAGTIDKVLIIDKKKEDIKLAQKGRQCRIDRWLQPVHVHIDTEEILEKIREEYELTDDIVRCKECKRSYIEGQTTLYRVCGLHDITTDENNYCSWGEREGE